jgi:hypothetical protein
MMAGGRLFTPLRIACFIAALGLMGTPWGPATGWASMHETRGMNPVGHAQQTERRPSMSRQANSTVLPEQSPQTIDEDAAFVQNRP